MCCFCFFGGVVVRGTLPCGCGVAVLAALPCSLPVGRQAAL